MVLNGLLEKLDLGDKAVAVLRALDKLGKDGAASVMAELQERAGLSSHQATEVLRMAALEGDNETILRELDSLVEGIDVGMSGVARLREILVGFQAAGADPARLKLDVATARGLDYYTGPVYETVLDDLPSIGSVCSGGRYDDLAGLFTRQKLPGVGASLGLDRLLAAQEELGLVVPARTLAPVLVAFFSPQRLADDLRLASWVRKAGIGVELYPEPKKIGQQLKYADRKGFRAVLIAGEDELAAGCCQVKDLKSGEQQQVQLADEGHAVIAALSQMLTS
jgi:histidyl-tRNA synthetase